MRRLGGRPVPRDVARVKLGSASADGRLAHRPAAPRPAGGVQAIRTA